MSYYKRRKLGHSGIKKATILAMGKLANEMKWEGESEYNRGANFECQKDQFAQKGRKEGCHLAKKRASRRWRQISQRQNPSIHIHFPFSCSYSYGLPSPHFFCVYAPANSHTKSIFEQIQSGTFSHNNHQFPQTIHPSTPPLFPAFKSAKVRSPGGQNLWIENGDEKKFVGKIMNKMAE
jgi:hypothetical protein